VGFIRAEDLDALRTPNNLARSLDEVWTPQAGARPRKTQAMAAWSDALLNAFKAAGGRVPNDFSVVDLTFPSWRFHFLALL
jgi:hypothetical protein